MTQTNKGAWVTYSLWSGSFNLASQLACPRRRLGCHGESLRMCDDKDLEPFSKAVPLRSWPGGRWMCVGQMVQFLLVRGSEKFHAGRKGYRVNRFLKNQKIHEMISLICQSVGEILEIKA